MDDDFRDAVLIAMLEHPEHAEEIAQWASENGEESLEESSEHGPPPSPGLVFDETKHRWVRPEGSGAGVSQSDKEAIADKASQSMGVKAKVVVTTVKSDHAGRGGHAPMVYDPIAKEHRVSPSIVIRDDGTLTSDQIEKIIHHETAHIKQSEDGRFIMKKNEYGNNAYFWEGKEVIEDKSLSRIIGAIKGKGNLKSRYAALEKYKALPWEAEAYGVADPDLSDAIPAKKLESSEHESDLHENKSGVFTDANGHKYRLVDGKRAPLGNESADAEPGVEHALEGLADKLPDEAKSPGTWGKIKSFVASAGSAIYTGATKLGHKLHDLAPDILDVAADYSKIFYAGRGDSNQNTPDPFMNSLGVGSSTVAVIASHILGRASVWIRSKLAGRKQEAVAGTLSIDQKAKAVADLLNELNRSLGTEETVDAATVAEWLKSLEGQ